MRTARRTLLLQLWRALFILILLTTETFSRPVQLTEETRVERDTAKQGKVGSTNNGGKIQKEDGKSEEKKDDEVLTVIFQGDIIIPYEELLDIQGISEEEARGLPRLKRLAGSGENEPPVRIYNKLWPDCRVPYRVDPLLNGRLREVFFQAMMMWEKSTCIRFRLATQRDEDYIVLRKGSICKSYIGKQGGPQDVYIADQCNTTGHALHELGHAIGLWHEHSRPDRDQFIRYHEENVFNKFDRVNFRVINSQQFKEMPFVRYDIQSIMHYSAYAFTQFYEPGRETITVREDANIPELNCTNILPMGQRLKLSHLDKKRLNLLYGCEFDLEEPECLLPTPSATTPPETTEPITTTMPTPTTTMGPPPLDDKLSTGNIIALKFFPDNGIDYGIECFPTPGCIPTQYPCENLGGDTCTGALSQFQIINHRDHNSPLIRNGNTVLLRSVDSPSTWLDCSDISRCVLSPCEADYVEDPGNASYISNCSKHHFEVGGRSKRKPMTVNHKMQLKYGNHGYLNCNHDICHVLEEGECPSRPILTPRRPPKNCKPEKFNVTKLYE